MADPAATAVGPEVDPDIGPQVHLGAAVAACLAASAVVGGLWYLAVVGTDSQMGPVSLFVGWAAAAALTKVARRHGASLAVYSVAVTATVVLAVLFYVQRRWLNLDPRNHIPAWANPTIVAEVFRVGFSVWPSHNLWLLGAMAVCAWRTVRGPHRPHPHLLELYRGRTLAAGEHAPDDVA